VRACVRVCVRVCVCVRLTAEEVVLALQHLADLQDPDLADPGVGGVELEGLSAAVSPPGRQGEPAGIPLLALLQTQTAYLHNATHGYMYWILEKGVL